MIGGGLAGSEAAWQLAEHGHDVELLDMKPTTISPAHQTPLLSELVCSNSFRSNEVTVAAGLLKAELRLLGSVVVSAADKHRVPAGSALAVDRFGFGKEVTKKLSLHPRIKIRRGAVQSIPSGKTIIATGPLTHGTLAKQVQKYFGGPRLYFYDAIAPIVDADSIDEETSFRCSRWGKGTDDLGDYINCPLTKEEYEEFVADLLSARKVTPHAFEKPKYFEGCLPIEVMAERGLDVLRYGPMRPVGLTDPRTGRWPHAALQLRCENEFATAYNLVGFQTRLAYPEQKRIFAKIPALRNAEFLRFGSIHRNTFIDSPAVLGGKLEVIKNPDLRFAGLLTGVEGYIESCASGMLAGLFLAHELSGRNLSAPPVTSALGGLLHHTTRAREEKEAFSPTNVNFGLMPGLEGRVKKRDRKGLLAARAQKDFVGWLSAENIQSPTITPALPKLAV